MKSLVKKPKWIQPVWIKNNPVKFKSIDFKPLNSVKNKKSLKFPGALPILSVRKKKTIPKRPNRNLTYPQAIKTYNINPFGDWDKDKVPNWRDCRMFNPFLHAVPPEHAERSVGTYTDPGSTFASVFRQAEEQLPRVFKQPQEEKDDFDEDWERDYSGKLSNALLKRKEILKTPFKDVIGVHTIKIPMNPDKVLGIFRYLDETLSRIYPNREFEFSLKEPTSVTITDYDVPVGEKGRKYTIKLGRVFGHLKTDITTLKRAGVESKHPTDVSNLAGVKYLERTVKHMEGLLQELNPKNNVKVWITDSPVDILRKSTDQGWRSCERITPWEEYLDKSEFCPDCREWGRGGFEDGPFADIGNWHAIAYFYLGGRRPKIDKPSGRTMMRWGESGRGDDIGIEHTVYPFNAGDGLGQSGNSPLAQALIYGLQEILQEKGYGKGNTTAPLGGAYSDLAGSEDFVTYRTHPKPDIKPTKEIHEWKKSFAGSKPAKSFLPFLGTESDESIIRGISGHRGLSPGRIGAFSRHPSKDIRLSITRREKLEPEVQERLIKDTSPDVRVGMLSYPKYIEGETKQVYREFPEETLKELLSNANVADRILNRENVPEHILMAMANHDSYYVKKSLARRGGLSLDIIKKLLKDENDEVLSSLLDSYIDTIMSKKMLSNILFDRLKKGSSNVKYVILKYINRFPEALDMVKSLDPKLRANIATNIHLKPEIALELSKDKNETVIVNLLYNSSMLNDLDKITKQRMISNMLPTAISRGYEDAVRKMSLKLYLTGSHIKKLLDYALKNKNMNVLYNLVKKRGMPEAIRSKVFIAGVESGNSGILAAMMDNPDVTGDVKQIVIKMWDEAK